MNADDARCDGSHRSLATELDLGALVCSVSVLSIACFVLLVDGLFCELDFDVEASC